MKKIIIEKYIQDKLDETFTVPVIFIQTLNTILPDIAFESLKQNGFDFQQIVTASKLNETYFTEVLVNEKGVDKKIIIKLD